jgi:hypothetical protein
MTRLHMARQAVCLNDGEEPVSEFDDEGLQEGATRIQQLTSAAEIAVATASRHTEDVVDSGGSALQATAEVGV